MIRLSFYSFALLGALTLIVTTTGCQSDPFDVQPVTGTITYNGVPVEGAMVAFVEIEGCPTGRGAWGQTDANGAYTLWTYAATRPGAAPGTYNVFVTKAVVVDRQGNEFVGEGAPPIDPATGGPLLRHLIPRKYSGHLGQTVLSATVQRGQNVFDFNLED